MLYVTAVVVISVVVMHSGNALCLINELNLHQAALLLG